MGKIKRSVSMILSVLMAASVLTTAPVSAATVEASDAGANVAEAVQAELKIAEGSCGDKLTWVLDNDGVLEISGEGKMYDFDFEAKEGENSFNPWTLYRDQIKKVVVKDGVEYIGNFAFFGFAELEEAQIADSVKEIGENAFEGCDKLDKTTLPEAFTEPATEAVTEVATEEETTEAVAEEAVVEETTKNSPIVVKEEEEAVGAAAEEAVGATAISSCTITLGATSYTYDGNAKKPSVTVKNGSKTLVKGTDYSLAYKNNINAGTATVTVTGKGSYSGSVAKNYTIKKRAISSATIKLSTANYIYNGAARTPAVTATYNSIDLVKGTDFSVAYTRNVKVGTATVTITGEGTNFTGTTTKTFTIQKKSLTKCTVTIDDSACTYTGKSVYPKITVKDGSKELKIGTDFGPIYTNNVDAGTQVLKLQGIGNYGDIVETSYTIKPKSITTATVTPEYTTTQFDITRKRPTAIVMDGTKELVANTDFTYGYSNNLEAGTATLLIKGTGNYTGTYKTYFTITPKPVSELTYKINSSSVVYDGTKKLLDMSVYHGNKYLVHGVNYYTEYTNNVNVGTATVKVIGCGSYSGTVTKTFKITKKPIGETNITLSATAFTYNGSAQSPTVTVTDGDKTLTNNTDYKYTVTNNISAGTATVTVTGLGNYGSTSTQTFKINAKSLTSSMVKLNQTSFDYDGKEKKADVTVTDGTKTLVNGTDYTLTYNDNTDAGAATVTVKGKGNYKGSISKSYSIKARQMSGCYPFIAQNLCYYTGSELRPAVVVRYGGTVLVEGTDYTLKYINNINVGTATCEITGKGNYAGTTTANFRIQYKFDESHATVTLKNNIYNYTGSEIEPEMTVKYGSKVLTKDTDYYLTYQNNIQPGTATVYVRGKGSYTGYIEKTFKIKTNQISLCKITVDCPDNEYDGKTKSYTVTVNDGSRDLEKGVDFTTSVNGPSLGSCVGTWGISVIGKGNYEGTAKTSVTIEPRDINKAIGFVSRTSFTLDESNKIRHMIYIKDNTTGNLTEINNSNFSVKYIDNPNGSIDAVVTGKGYYRGTKTIGYRPEAIPENTFIWESDNWNFNNAHPYFPDGTYGQHFDNNFSKNYDLTMNNIYSGLDSAERSKANKYINTFIDNLNNIELYRVFRPLYPSESSYINVHNNWGGSCYGMSSLILLSKSGVFPYSTFDSNAEKIHDFSSPANNSDLLSLITYYQLLQAKDSVQQNYSRTIPKTHKENLENIISLLNNNSVVLVGFQKMNETDGSVIFGHAILATGYADGYWNFNGREYQRCIYICDPNSSMNYNNRYNIYYNTSTYEWTIPAYNFYTESTEPLNYRKARFMGIEADPEMINNGGYLSLNRSTYNGNYICRANVYTSTGSCSASKALNVGGEYITFDDCRNDIFEVYSSLSCEDNEVYFGYNLLDSEASYVISQETPGDIQLSMNYENCYLEGGSAAGKSVVFDKDGYVSVEGDAASYDLNMIFNNSYATDWFAIHASGDNAENASLKMVDGGYVLSADKLENVRISANNRSVKAYADFSTEYNSVFIYEIDENTIGLRIDADNNGTYETELPSKKSEVICGDVNLDGTIDILDAYMLQNYISEFEELTDAQLFAADANNDGVVSVDDSLYIQLMLAELV